MCSEGWEPLCKFLGFPVPDEPFPHKNKGGDLAHNAIQEFPTFRKIQREIIRFSIIYTSFTVLAGVCVYKYGLNGIFHSARSCVDHAITLVGLKQP